MTMRHFPTRCALLILALSALRAAAEPFVAGFDRFHAAQPTADGGRLLYHELGCVNCHGGDNQLPARRGPKLAGVAQRTQAEWLRAFLTDPAAARAGTSMPHLLPAQDVDAVLHYLATLKVAAPKGKGARHVNAGRGRDLFHTIGCVACHAPDAEFRPPEGAPASGDFTHASVAFPVLGKKYVLSSLADFIREPLKVRPDGRMPQMAMEAQDATDLAGYLLNYEGSDGQIAPTVPPFRVDKALAERGRSIVAAARCAACHELPNDVAATPVAIRSADSGCMKADAPAPDVPRYDLGGAQRSALRLFLAAPSQPAPSATVSALTLQALNCTACHDRDGLGGPDTARKAYFQGDHNLGDTGRYPPPLTGVGRKLQPAWLADVLAGKARVRPYLKTQMPLYGDATAQLGALLATADAKAETPLPGGDDTAGRKLLGTLGGMGCITCHRWGARPSLGIQALDLSNLGQRLQPGWLAEYLVNPAAYRAGTLMPSFWPGGISANRDILGGDTARQIASIYSFAKSANGEPEGFPENQSGEFEIIPKEFPMVQRTFLESVGTHAILVGFPQRVHLAYDGKSGRPALAWRGKFFDGYTTWFSRFAPFEKPLGGSVVHWPASSASSLDIRFDGYRLDAKRVPIFLLTIAGTRVEDRFEPIEGGLRRTVQWNAATLPNLDLAHPEGVAATEESESTPGDRRFTYLWK
jgi:cytochrome c2